MDYKDIVVSCVAVLGGVVGGTYGGPIGLVAGFLAGAGVGATWAHRSDLRARRLRQGR